MQDKIHSVRWGNRVSRWIVNKLLFAYIFALFESSLSPFNVDAVVFASGFTENVSEWLYVHLSTPIVVSVVTKGAIDAVIAKEIA